MDVTKHIFIAFVVVVSPALLFAQNDEREYKKRVLENTEIELLSSFYQQDGNNAAVTGGLGTEELTDYTATVVVSIPINEDDILKIDAGVSAYTSASSSNIDPFEVGTPNPFISNSGASERDTWVNGTATYIHSSDDRNTNWSLKASVSNEYDYTSVGFGGSYAKLMNQKNTEIGFHGNVFLDSWRSIYPIELTDGNIVANNTITGNSDYSTAFSKFTNGNRNSYSGGVSLSQILSQKIQGSVIVDVIKQEGLLSTPFQRVYFADVEDSFIGDCHLADDVERLPNSRLKLALGGRLNAYVNEVMTLRSFMRYYQDDWGIVSGTAQIEMPIKQFSLN